MPRNRDDWNALELHLRDSQHELLGMNTMHGANELRKLARLTYRHMKIHKNKEKTVSYIVKKLNHLYTNGYPEVWTLEAISSLLDLLEPTWKYVTFNSIIIDELYVGRIGNGKE